MIREAGTCRISKKYWRRAGCSVEGHHTDHPGLVLRPRVRDCQGQLDG
jgi:hypothetical protein